MSSAHSGAGLKMAVPCGTEFRLANVAGTKDLAQH